MNEDLTEHCIYVLWMRYGQDKAITDLISQGTCGIPLGRIDSLAQDIVEGYETCDAAQRVLAQAVALRLRA